MCPMSILFSSSSCLDPTIFALTKRRNNSPVIPTRKDYQLLICASISLPLQVVRLYCLLPRCTWICVWWWYTNGRQWAWSCLTRSEMKLAWVYHAMLCLHLGIDLQAMWKNKVSPSRYLQSDCWWLGSLCHILLPSRLALFCWNLFSTGLSNARRGGGPGKV